MVEKPLAKETHPRPAEVGRVVEVLKEVEVGGEQGIEKGQRQEVQVAQLEQQARSVAPTASQNIVQKDPILQDVEDILANDLTDMFLGLSDQKKAEFKIKGEDVAMNIQKMMQSGRIQARKILTWIREWLRIIPGVNKFFLEQEAKIKQDQVMEYIEQR